jgi:uncharacterized protein
MMAQISVQVLRQSARLIGCGGPRSCQNAKVTPPNISTFFNAISAQTIALLIASNVFMTIAWYAHLKELATKPWYVAALLSWGVALFEYLLQVPANRIGYQQFSLAQLKIIQEVITLTVFIPFAVFYMKEPFKWDYIWACLCMLAAVYFIFRSA